MAKKKKFNLSVFERFAAAFEDSAKVYGEKQRWRACTGAVYLWLKLGPEKQRELANQMYAADGDPEELSAMMRQLGLESDGIPLRGRLSVSSTRQPAKPAPR